MSRVSKSPEAERVTANFNKVSFALVLTKAQGDRTFNQYGSDADVSPVHISRLTRQLIDNKPLDDTMQKLALHAHNGVVYEDLVKSLL